MRSTDPLREAMTWLASSGTAAASGSTVAIADSGNNPVLLWEAAP
jgi:hypothetical protein